MAQPIVQVDAFTSAAFGGNPAAVCVLEQPREASWMQLVAREMNVAETAFLERRSDGDFDLRWFTPAMEVDLCGPATLAGAHALGKGGARATLLGFPPRRGVLPAPRRGDWIDLVFPAPPDEPIDPPRGLL